MSNFLHKSVLLVSVILLVFVFISCEQKPVEKVEPITPAINIKDNAAVTVVYLEKKGPYTETGKSMGELFSMMGKRNLKMRNYPMGLYYDDPEQVKPEDTRYEVMCQFVGEFKGDDDLKVKEIPAQKVASTVYVGPYEKCAPTYKKLYSWIVENKYEPCGVSFEKYLNAPDKVKAEELKTEICVPVKAATEEGKKEGK